MTEAPTMLVEAEVNLHDLAYQLIAEGIDKVKEFINILDGEAADSDFTNEIYTHIRKIWTDSNTELKKNGFDPYEEPVEIKGNLIINVTGTPAELEVLRREILKTGEAK